LEEGNSQKTTFMINLLMMSFDEYSGSSWAPGRD
jgi:hypothetical protein